MPPVILTLLQALFLLLLYVFVGRAVRAIARDLSPSAAPGGPLPKLRGGKTRAAKPRKSAAARLPKLGRSETRPEPRELVVHLPGGAPRVLPLGPDVDAAVTFGRAHDVTVPLDDPYASDRHARVYRTEEGWLVTDIGSTNGTYLNGKKLTAPVRLAAGDQLAIGKTVIEVRR